MGIEPPGRQHLLQARHARTHRARPGRTWQGRHRNTDDSTQEYLAIKQDLAEPDPLRLAWRDFIKQIICEVITNPELDPLSSIQRSVAERVPKQEQSDVQALIVEELRRLHEGVLARYGLRPSEYAAWKALHGH